MEFVFGILFGAVAAVVIIVMVAVAGIAAVEHERKEISEEYRRRTYGEGAGS